MADLKLFQFIEVKNIRGTNSGTSNVMTSVSTGKASGTSWVDCSFQVLGVYVNFMDPSGTSRRLVSSSVSILLGSGLSSIYDTIVVDETLSDEYGLVFFPDAPLIVPSKDYFLVNIGGTNTYNALGHVTIHIGF